MDAPVPIRLAALLDGFVPAAIREKADDEPVRARTAVGIALLASAVFAALAAIRLLWARPDVAVVNTLQAAAMAAFPFVLRRTGRLRLLVLIALSFVSCSFVVLIVTRFGAGLTMPAMGLAMVPLLAVLLVGLGPALAWLLFACGCFGVTYFLGRASLLAHRGVETLAAEHASLVVAASVLYLVGGLYEYRKNQALLRIESLEERRHRAERARLQAQTEAKLSEAERLAALGEIAAMAAHEINNPLSYVSHNLDWVKTRLGTPAPEVEEALREATDGVVRIQRIVQDLQQYGRPEQDEAGIADIAVVIETALKTVEGHTRPRARVVTDIASVPKVVGSHGRLVQVLLNLVVNAAQAIPEGRADENEIGIQVREQNGRVVVQVTDTGPGIPEDVLSKVKEPFFTTKTGRGTGLGLALSERILTRFGGELAIENGPRGAVARVTLFAVMEEGPPTEAAVPSPHSSGPASRMRLLVVDDEPLVARAIRRHLPEHDVRIVTSGREALELLDGGQRFDRILCDMMMPDLTGMDVHELLSKRHRGLAERVVFMTGGTFTPRMREFRAAVRNPFLQKPVRIDELRALLVR
ncbi:MAG TPA: ATP-binding protein [Polyangiaceae bacterium]|nr:ATP-binding protein [Polyangiaceae bacterium]